MKLSASEAHLHRLSQIRIVMDRIFFVTGPGTVASPIFEYSSQHRLRLSKSVGTAFFRFWLHGENTSSLVLNQRFTSVENVCDQAYSREFVWIALVHAFRKLADAAPSLGFSSASSRSILYRFTHCLASRFHPRRGRCGCRYRAVSPRSRRGDPRDLER